MTELQILLYGVLLFSIAISAPFAFVKVFAWVARIGTDRKAAEFGRFTKDLR